MTTLSNIKNIIFDLGGVILNIDPQKTLEKLYKMGVPPVDNLKALLSPDSPPTLYEIGAISSDEFRKWIKEQAGKDISDEMIDNAWTAMLLDIPVHRVEFLKQLSAKYRLFLFSNTNEIHQKHYEQMFKKYYHFQFGDLFEKVYYSHVMGLRKPEPEGFLHIINENSLQVSETLFVDDMEDNVLAAESLGMKGFHLKANMDISEMKG